MTSMWDWITKSFPRRTGQEPAAPGPVRRSNEPLALTLALEHPRNPGRYGSLRVYLERRYADVVVLTFGQMEDLLGFPLPHLARTRREWWTSDVDGEQPPQSDAWKLAGRTATPNLSAKTVAFARARL
jgi:hypothetical protein